MSEWAVALSLDEYGPSPLQDQLDRFLPSVISARCRDGFVSPKLN